MGVDIGTLVSRMNEKVRKARIKCLYVFSRDIMIERTRTRKEMDEVVIGFFFGYMSLTGTFLSCFFRNSEQTRNHIFKFVHYFELRFNILKV